MRSCKVCDAGESAGKMTAQTQSLIHGHRRKIDGRKCGINHTGSRYRGLIMEKIGVMRPVLHGRPSRTGG